MVVLKVVANSWWLWPILLMLWCVCLKRHLRLCREEHDELGSSRHNRGFILGLSLIVLIIGGTAVGILKAASSTIYLGILLQ